MYLEKVKKEKKEQEEYKKRIKEQIQKDRADQSASRKQQQATSSIKSPSPDNKSFYDHCNLNIKQLNGTSLKHHFSRNLAQYMALHLTNSSVASDTLTTVSNWIDTASITHMI